jgi:putative hydrolase of the HAD superfamily
VKKKVILFDLGGVLFNLNYQQTARAFRKLGLADFDAVYSQARQDGLFDAFEKGLITAAGFRSGLRQWLPADLSDAAIDEAWNAMLLGIPASKIQLLEKLKDRYRLFLLSNTNEIHLDAVFRMNQEAHGFKDLSRYMEKQYYSCALGMRKPDAEIFQFVLRDIGVPASDVFFIDDSIRHIEGARSVGIEAHHLQDPENLALLFPD